MKQFDIPSESSDKIGVTVRVVNNNTRNLPIIQHANTVRRIPKCIIVYNLLVSTRRYAVSANDHWASRFTTTRSRSPCAYYTFAGEINPGCTRARVRRDDDGRLTARFTDFGERPVTRWNDGSPPVIANDLCAINVSISIGHYTARARLLLSVGNYPRAARTRPAGMQYRKSANVRVFRVVRKTILSPWRYRSFVRRA